jgi:hypothetical protein
MQGRVRWVGHSKHPRNRPDVQEAWAPVISKSLSSTKQSARQLEAGRRKRNPHHFLPSQHIIMVHIHCAYTEQINPKGAEPVLSRDQVGCILAFSFLEVILPLSSFVRRCRLTLLGNIRSGKVCRERFAMPRISCLSSRRRM